jgi:hypothetical protein
VFVVLVGNLMNALFFLRDYAAQNARRPEWVYWDAVHIDRLAQRANTINEFNEETIIHIGLRAIDITRLNDYKDYTTPLVDDPFANLVVEPPEVRKTQGRQPKKRQEASDSKGPLEKPRKE